MSFIVDKQTIKDLNLLGKYDSKSIFHIYDRAKTRGGRKLMEEMFLSPLSDSDAINARSRRFGVFMANPVSFPFDEEAIESAENYLSMPARGGRLANFLRLFGKKSLLYISGNRIIETMGSQILGLLRVFDRLVIFSEEYASRVSPHASDAEEISELLSLPGLRSLLPLKNEKNLTFAQIVRCHYALTAEHSDAVNRLMQIIYRLDLEIAVAGVATERGFCVATATSAAPEQSFFRGEAIFHPAIKGAKGNDLTLDRTRNMLLLTGANMAGKSTFMKSVGIALYLAHMGFPVPAKSLDFTACDGLFTSINVSDDLTKGYSHYYAEVMRVKKVATSVAEGHNLFVILDELFKGTNVKDALDATFAVLKALSHHHNCFFVVSTHILEAAGALKELPNVKFGYLPTVIVNGLPEYTYRLTEGISEDRQGMMLIRKEQIVERIKERID